MSLLHASVRVQQLPSSHVQYDCLGIDSSKLLEKAVKNSSYPPTIKCIVEYRKKLQKTGIRTLVGLHISGMDPELNFQCTAYERDQGDCNILYEPTCRMAH